jgi:hypothetical protein
MAPFSNLLAALADVPDPRRVQDKRYPLPYLLMFTVLALLSGARSYRGVITFLEQRREHLNDHFGVILKRAEWVNTALGNIKTAITATYRAIRPKHIDRIRLPLQSPLRSRRHDAPPRLGRRPNPANALPPPQTG